MAPIVFVIATITSMQCGIDVLCWRGVEDPKTGKVENYYLELDCVTALRKTCPQGGTHALLCKCIPTSELRK